MMDIPTAKVILGVDGPLTMDSLNDIYQKKKAKFLSKQFAGTDYGNDMLEIEDAFAILVQDLQSMEDKNHSLVPVQQKQSISPLSPSFSWTQNSVTGVPLSPCPNCGELIPLSVLVCNYCNTQIGRSCPSCGNVVRLVVRTCDRCGTYIQEFDRKRYATVLATEQRISRERAEVEMNASRNEQQNSRFVGKGILVWLVIIAIILAFCALSFLLFSDLLVQYA